MAIDKTQQYSDVSPKIDIDKIKQTDKVPDRADYEISAVRLDFALAT